MKEVLSLDYLQKLNRRYESWIETYNTGKLLIVDVDKLNFIQNKEDLGFIIELIDGELNGLFS